MKIRYITKASLIAAIYLVLILIKALPFPVANLTFGPVQLRIAEGLTLLPLVEPAAVPGLFIGVLLANFLLAPYSGFGLVDIIGGSLVTLLAAYLTSKAKNKYVGMVPPILLNGIIVSIWVSYFTKIPYIYTALGITAGQFVSVVVFGSVILYVYEKASKYREW